MPVKRKSPSAPQITRNGANLRMAAGTGSRWAVRVPIRAPGRPRRRSVPVGVGEWPRICHHRHDAFGALRRVQRPLRLAALASDHGDRVRRGVGVAFRVLPPIS
jgi:hypothetical protein